MCFIFTNIGLINYVVKLLNSNIANNFNIGFKS